MAIWEYVTVIRDGENMLDAKQLNDYGAKGFELVTVVPFARDEMVVGKMVQRQAIHYFFKRPRADAKG